MKNVQTILAVLFLFTTTMACSQSGGEQRGPQHGPPPVPNAKQIKKMVNELSQELELSEKQEKSILKIHTDHFDKVKAKTSSKQPPRREEMDALQTNLQKKVKEVLTKDQIKKYEAYMKKNASKRPQQRRK